MTFSGRLRRAVDYGRGALRGFRRVRIAAGVRLSGPGTYRLQPGSCVREGARIWVGPGATLTLEHGSAIGARNVVNVEVGLTIGEGTQVSWDSQLLDTDFHRITDRDGVVREHSGAITIGEHVLIGTGVMVLKGVTIGDGAVVAAGSVVTKSVPPGTIVAGNPARPVGELSRWD
ncbi:MAG: tetrahydrodipicolinate N-acetyltransferase [Microbacteriaceae bacterium]|jgi:acetyltransferase-like isoleucine patch superfamily enzyme|nr:tetrahydrodipicolinate N-acetyltransferase [Microbacteriaceae bacterium]